MTRGCWIAWIRSDASRRNGAPISPDLMARARRVRGSAARRPGPVSLRDSETALPSTRHRSVSGRRLAGRMIPPPNDRPLSGTSLTAPVSRPNVPASVRQSERGRPARVDFASVRLRLLARRGIFVPQAASRSPVPSRRTARPAARNLAGGRPARRKATPAMMRLRVRQGRVPPSMKKSDEFCAVTRHCCHRPQP